MLANKKKSKSWKSRKRKCLRTRMLEEGGGQEQAQNRFQCHELLDAERNRYAELEARYLRLAADF